MTSSNAEVFRRAVEAMNEGRFVEEVARLTTPDVEFIPLRTPITGVFHGHDGLRDFWRDTQETFDVFRLDLDEVREHENGRVFATGTFTSRGRGSNVETTSRSAAVVTFREGKIRRVHDYGDAAEARRALEA